MEFRKTEVKRNNEWVEIEFIDMKKGDVFRLTEPTGEFVSVWGLTQFTAASDAFLNEDGIGCVHTEENKEYADAK